MAKSNSRAPFGSAGRKAHQRAAAVAAGKIGLTPGRLAAQRIVAAALAGITSITQVMASPPTYAEGASNAASSLSGTAATYQTTSNPAAGVYTAGDPLYMESVGGVMTLDPVSGGGIFGQNNLSVVSTGVRRGAHGIGLKFRVTGIAFDVCMNTNALPIVVYVTNPATGVRQRVTANDQVTTVAGNAYHKWTFPGTGTYDVEIYTPIAQKIRQITCNPANTTISRVPANTSLPVVAALGDSFMDGVTSGGTNTVKLTGSDYLAAKMGLPNIIGAGRAGTGILNSGGTYGNYLERVQQGSLDINPRAATVGTSPVPGIGVADVVLIPASVNDVDTAIADLAAYSLAVKNTVLAVRTAQPNAIIVVLGPQLTKAKFASMTQALWDAVRDGVTAAGDANTIYIDNKSWFTWDGSTGNLSIYGGTDNTHLNDAGGVYWGDTFGLAVVNAVKAKYGL